MYAVLIADKTAVEDTIQSCLSAYRIAAWCDAQQAVQQFGEGFASLAGAEVQHQGAMRFKPALCCPIEQMVAQTGLPDSGFAAQQCNLAAALLTADRKQAFQPSALALAADEGACPAIARRLGQTDEFSGDDRTFDALDLQRTGRLG